MKKENQASPLMLNGSGRRARPQETSWKRISRGMAHLFHLPRIVYAALRQGQQRPHIYSGDDSIRHLSEHSEFLLQAQERERQRIATDLHDSIGQNLCAVKMAIEVVLKAQEGGGERYPQKHVLDAALTRVRSTIDDLRRIALDLRPTMLDDLGLLTTLECFCREFSQTNPQMTLLQFITVEEREVPRELRCDLYRVIQEALHNVVKHAEAKSVELHLSRNGKTLVLVIIDDGRGFDLQGRRGDGLGLNSMRARSERGGGRLQIHSAPGVGTRVEVCWPLPRSRGERVEESSLYSQ